VTFLSKVKPHLRHKDLFVQQFVVNSLMDYPNTPVEWTNELLQEAIEVKEKEFSILMGLNNHTFNAQSLSLLQKGLKQSTKDREFLYTRLMTRVPPAIIWKHKDELNSTISEEWWNIYDIVLHGDEEKVWGTFGLILNKLDEEGPYNNDLYEQAKLLLQTIVQNGWIEEGEIDIVMNEELNNDWFSFAGILMVHAIGLLQIKRYIPILANLLIRDEDTLLEELTNTLVSFQSDDAVKAVTPYIQHIDSNIYAISVLENTKTELSVQTLKSMYNEVDDEETKALIIEALCHHYEESAFHYIEDFLRNNYDTLLLDWEELAYGFFTLMEKPHPLLNEWKAIAIQKEATFHN